MWATVQTINHTQHITFCRFGLSRIVNNVFYRYLKLAPSEMVIKIFPNTNINIATELCFPPKNFGFLDFS